VQTQFSENNLAAEKLMLHSLDKIRTDTVCSKRSTQWLSHFGVLSATGQGLDHYFSESLIEYYPNGSFSSCSWNTFVEIYFPSFVPSYPVVPVHLGKPR
jgi:hypothetical protein